MITKNQIKAARALLGITQLELAKKAGVSLATLNNIEHSEHTDPRISTITKIRTALEKSGIEFTGESDSMQGLRLKSLKTGGTTW
jgi:transcriptional regulator with XRE-family HTH domain